MTFRSDFSIMSLKSKFVGNKQPQTPRQVNEEEFVSTPKTTCFDFLTFSTL